MYTNRINLILLQFLIESEVLHCIVLPFPKGVLDSTQIHSLDCIYVTMKFTGNV